MLCGPYPARRDPRIWIKCIRSQCYVDSNKEASLKSLHKIGSSPCVTDVQAGHLISCSNAQFVGVPEALRMSGCVVIGTEP